MLSCNDLSKKRLIVTIFMIKTTKNFLLIQRLKKESKTKYLMKKQMLKVKLKIQKF